MTERIVHCRLLKKDLPGLDRPPFKNDLGRRLYEEVSKEGWRKWLDESVRHINTQGIDLASPAGQKKMFDLIETFFGFQQGDMPQTAWTPPKKEDG